MSVSVVEASDPVIQDQFDYDSAAVGSSPISVVNATLERLQGRSVIVVDARNIGGGAWAGDTVCGMSGIDIGSHDLCLKQANAEFLEKFFGVGCIKVGDNRYLPKGGCAQMSERLIQIAQRAGVVFKMNCRVEKATLVDQGVVLDCADVLSGQPLKITAKKVIRPTNVAFEVYRGSDKISDPIQTVNKQHLYFIVKDGSSSTGYFLKLMSISGIRRISNLTSLAPLSSQDQRMFVVELGKAIPDDQVVAKCGQIVLRLQAENHLSLQAEIIKCDARAFTYSSVVVRTTDDDLDKFKRLDTDYIEKLRHYEQPFTDLGDVGLLSLQKCFLDAAPQSAEDLAVAS
jgi:hypothetical protein